MHSSAALVTRLYECVLERRGGLHRMEMMLIADGSFFVVLRRSEICLEFFPRDLAWPLSVSTLFFVKIVQGLSSKTCFSRNCFCYSSCAWMGRESGFSMNDHIIRRKQYQVLPVDPIMA